MHQVVEPGSPLDPTPGTNRPLSLVLRVELLLLVVGLTQEVQGRRKAPRLVVGASVEVELVERPVGIHPVGVLPKQPLVLLDCVAHALRHGRVELGQDLVLGRLVRLDRARRLERLRGGLEVPLPVSVDDAEGVEEVELQVLAALVLDDPVDHLAVGPLERLPILLGVEDLVDGLERLEVVRVEIEGLVEAVERPIRVLQLVTGDDADRVDVLRLRPGPAVDIGDLLDDANGLFPLPGLLVRGQELVEHAVLLRLQESGLVPGLDGLLGVLLLVLPEGADLVEDLEALAVAVDRLEDLLLEVDDLRPLALLLVEPDDRVERRPMVRILLQGLVEHVEGLAALPLLALDDAQAVEDVDDLVRRERVAVVDEEHLVELEGVAPTFRREGRPSETEERRQVGRVDLLRLLEGLDGLLDLLELHGRLAELEGQAMLLVGLALPRALHQHLEQREGILVALGLPVLVHQRHRGVLVVRVLLERRLVGLDGLGVLIEAVVVDPPQLDQ